MNADELLSYAVDLTQAEDDDGGFVARDSLGDVRLTLEGSRLWITDERGPHAPDAVAVESQRAVRAALRPRAPLPTLRGEVLTSLGRLRYAVEGRFVPVHAPRPALNVKAELSAAAPLKIGGHLHERLTLMVFENGDAPRLMLPRHGWSSLRAGLDAEVQAEAWTLSQLLVPLMFTPPLVAEALDAQARSAADEANSKWHAAWGVVTRRKAALMAHHAAGAVPVGARGVWTAGEVAQAHAAHSGGHAGTYTRGHEL